MTSRRRGALDDQAEHSDVSAVFRSSFPESEDTDFRARAWRQPPATLRPLYPTVLHALAAAARARRELGVTLLPDDEDETPTHHAYAEIWDGARRMAAAFLHAGVRPGERVLLVLPTGFDFLVSFFGAQMAGAIPVPSYPPAALEKVETGLERIAHIAGHSGSVMLVTQRKLKTLLGSLLLSVRSLRAVRSAEGLWDEAPAQRPRVRARRNDLAFIQYTSGSTGNPKGVSLTHHNLVCNVHAAGLSGKIRRGDRMVSWLPLYHDMGLIGGILWPIYWQIPLVLLSPTAFLLRPVRWLRAIQDFAGTVSMAPNFAYGLCVKRIRPSDREGLDLSSWRIALNGAEPVNLRTVRDFQESFALSGLQKTVMFPCYGLAESSVAVTFPEAGTELHHRVVDRAALLEGRVVERRGPGSMALVCAGQPLLGHEVQLLDERGRPVGEGRVGHVVVRGPSVMQGYFRAEEATRQVLKDGRLWTGDLGFVMPEGLYITGRAKDLLIVRGKNHYAEDIERVAERVAGVRSGGSIAFALYDEAQASDVAVLVCETKLRAEPARAKLVEHITERVSEDVGLLLDEVVLVPPGALPKTSSGKRQRGLCRERYLQNTLGARRTGALRLAWVFVRSAAGFLLRLRPRRSRRREPD